MNFEYIKKVFPVGWPPKEELTLDEQFNDPRVARIASLCTSGCTHNPMPKALLKALKNSL